MRCRGIANLAALQDALKQGLIIARRQGAAMGCLALQFADPAQRLFPGGFQPKFTRVRAGRAGGQCGGNGEVMFKMFGKRSGRGVVMVKDQPGQPSSPFLAFWLCLGRSGQQIGGGWERRAISAQLQLELSGEQQMRTALAGSGIGDRVFEQGQQLFAGQGFAEQTGDLTQESAGRGQGQGATGAVIGDQVPAIQRGADLAGQGAVRCDQRGDLTLFKRAAQGGGDGTGFGTGRGGLDQGHVGGGLGKVGQILAFDQPLIGDRCRAQSQRDQPVAGRVCGCGFRGPFDDVPRMHAKRTGEFGKAILRVILGRKRVIERVPHGIRHVEINAGKDQRTLGQLGNCTHEQPGCPTGTGGPGHDNRVLRRRLRPSVG